MVPFCARLRSCSASAVLADSRCCSSDCIGRCDVGSELTGEQVTGNQRHRPQQDNRNDTDERVGNDQPIAQSPQHPSPQPAQPHQQPADDEDVETKLAQPLSSVPEGVRVIRRSSSTMSANPPNESVVFPSLVLGRRTRLDQALNSIESGSLGAIGTVVSCRLPVARVSAN